MNASMLMTLLSNQDLWLIYLVMCLHHSPYSFATSLRTDYMCPVAYSQLHKTDMFMEFINMMRCLGAGLILNITHKMSCGQRVTTSVSSYVQGIYVAITSHCYSFTCILALICVCFSRCYTYVPVPK